MINSWEYKLVDTLKRPETIKDIELYLNQLGQEGWELCGIDYRCFIMKRKLID